ncbi:unnamed protein product [Toxocara canis]|uniref:MSP domain-containing protein n=1 Tax=Toxocara canis TaxID=6265 RepID=A0A183U4P5_TOXCA|nr:unnamed protein product [Toxocara canis]
MGRCLFIRYFYRHSFEVRCSDNSLFRVCPVYMFVEAGSCNNLVITRLPGPPKVDKLVFHYVPCTERDLDPKDVFKKRTKPESIKLPMDTIAPDDALQVSVTNSYVSFSPLALLWTL